MHHESQHSNTPTTPGVSRTVTIFFTVHACMPACVFQSWGNKFKKNRSITKKLLSYHCVNGIDRGGGGGGEDLICRGVHAWSPQEVSMHGPAPPSPPATDMMVGWLEQMHGYIRVSLPFLPSIPAGSCNRYSVRIQTKGTQYIQEGVHIHITTPRRPDRANSATYTYLDRIQNPGPRPPQLITYRS